MVLSSTVEARHPTQNAAIGAQPSTGDMVVGLQSMNTARFTLGLNSGYHRDAAGATVFNFTRSDSHFRPYCRRTRNRKSWSGGVLSAVMYPAPRDTSMRDASGQRCYTR
jgi:hypothetical protein